MPISVEEKTEILEKIATILKDIKGKKDCTPESTIQHIKSIRKVLSTLAVNLKALDNDFINENSFNDLVNEIESCHNESQNFAENNDVGHIDNLYSNLNNIINIFQSMYMADLSIQENITAHKQILEKSFDDVSNYATGKNTEIQKLIVDLEDAFEPVNNTLKTHLQTIDGIVQDSTNRLTESEKEQQQEFNTIKEKLNTELNKYKNTIKVKHDEILTLAGIVAGDTYASEYTKNADNEKEQANFWRNTTLVISMVVFIGLVSIAYVLLSNDTDNMGYSQLLYKASIMTPLLLIAYYVINFCSKQSVEHRQKEQYFKDFVLKSKSLDPYISNLDKDLQSLLKTFVAGELFANHNNTSNANTDNQSNLKQQIANKIIEWLSTKVEKKSNES